MPDALPVPRDQREAVTVEVVCPACKGIGYFGRATSPPCGACMGHGKCFATLASPVDAAAVRVGRARLAAEVAAQNDAPTPEWRANLDAIADAEEALDKAISVAALLRAAKGGTDATG